MTFCKYLFSIVYVKCNIFSFKLLLLCKPMNDHINVVCLMSARPISITFMKNVKISEKIHSFTNTAVTVSPGNTDQIFHFHAFQSFM